MSGFSIGNNFFFKYSFYLKLIFKGDIWIKGFKQKQLKIFDDKLKVLKILNKLNSDWQLLKL